MDVARRIRDRGYRMTRQRRLVWEALRSADRHLTAEEIMERLRPLDPDLNISSVYRTLTLLAELELAQAVRLGDSSGYWELAHPDDEYHLVCRSCGTVAHHPGQLVDNVRRHLLSHGFEADEVNLVVHGRCERCRRPT